MYQTYGSELARSRMQDRMRDAERYRMAKDARGAQPADGRSTFRKLAGVALYVVAWPIKH